MVNRALRIVFFGTPEFAVPTLDALLRSRHPVVGVVTQPDRPRGRGHRVSDAPVKQQAQAAGIPILQPDTLKTPEFLDALRAFAADLGIVAAYGRILTDAVLAVPPLGMINVHASLLPRYRGAAPVHRAVIAGDTETGVTIMRVVKALDAGPMLATVRRRIGPDETSDQVEQSLASLGADLLVATVDALHTGRAVEIPQDDRAATYAPRLTKADGVVDWSATALRIHNLIRGLHPWPHAFAHVADRRIILHRSTVRHSGGPDDPGPATEPGTILRAHGDHLDVATGDGVLGLLEIQAEGKRPMAARDFLAGHALRQGDRFTSPPSS
jgi:methionyl-tRNA formyltransferase